MREDMPQRVVPLAAAGAAIVALLGLGVGARVRQTRRARGLPADVGYMRAMHDAMRRDMERIVADTARGADTAEEWDELRHWMLRHHEAEDDDLWPLLRQHLTSADDQHKVDTMISEHRLLAERVDAVDAAQRANGDLGAAMRALKAALTDHLSHEEALVLPLLHDHLSQAEWHGFLTAERRRTPLRERPQFLGWVLNDATPADADAVLSELPRPGRVAYRRIIGPRYARRHARAS